MKLKNSQNFFRRKLTPVSSEAPQAPTPQPTPQAPPLPPAHPRNQLLARHVKQVVDLLAELGQKRLAQLLLQRYNEYLREHFTVAVVGEFSRGKSTFLNHLLQLHCLPVGNLPTTALLTRIRHGESERVSHLAPNATTIWQGELSERALERFIAEPAREPEGHLSISTNNQWLQQNALEFIDTPGAGDLNHQRARQLSDALFGSDGLIVTISATQALSESEILFIRQRVISRKTPFLMLILTKLDEVKLQERPGVVSYVRQKLSSLGLPLPVFIPSKVEMPQGEYTDIMGMDKVRAHIDSWVADESRCSLKETWLRAHIEETLDMAIEALKQQQHLLELDDEKRQQLISEQTAALQQRALAWKELCLELMERENKCHETFYAELDGRTKEITERLQYEVSHASDLQKWWQEDYPYRVKIELANLAVVVQGCVTRALSADAQWFNSALNKKFKESVKVEASQVLNRQDIMAHAPEAMGWGAEDLSKKRQTYRLVTVAASMASVLLLCGTGPLALIATMGIGAASNQLSEKFFKQGIEKQREESRKLLARHIPQVIDAAISESRPRLHALYHDIISAARAKEEAWMDTQRSIIETSNKPKHAEALAKLSQSIDRLNKLRTIS